MQFQHDGSTAAQVGISSIQDIIVEDGDKQLLNLNNGARLPEGKDEECAFRCDEEVNERSPRVSSSGKSGAFAITYSCNA